MDFIFYPFIAQTVEKHFGTGEIIFQATEIKFEKPSGFKKVEKTRLVTVFEGLWLYIDKTETLEIANDIFGLIDFIELLKAFNGNKLDTSKEYAISSLQFRTAQRKGVVSLRLSKGEDFVLFLEKYECAALAAKLSKILNRCELWVDQEA